MNENDIDQAALRKEQTTLRNRLVDIASILDDNTAFSKDLPRLSVPFSRAEFGEILTLAKRHQTSPASLCNLAVRNLLIQARAGALPLVPPSTLDNATTVTCLGNPVD